MSNQRAPIDWSDMGCGCFIVLLACTILLPSLISECTKAYKEAMSDSGPPKQGQEHLSSKAVSTVNSDHKDK